METGIVILVLAGSCWLLLRRFVRQLRSGSGGCCDAACPGCPSRGKPGNCSGSAALPWLAEDERSGV